MTAVIIIVFIIMIVIYVISLLYRKKVVKLLKENQPSLFEVKQENFMRDFYSADRKLDFMILFGRYRKIVKDVKTHKVCFIYQCLGVACYSLFLLAAILVFVRIQMD